MPVQAFSQVQHESMHPQEATVENNSADQKTGTNTFCGFASPSDDIVPRHLEFFVGPPTDLSVRSSEECVLQTTGISEAPQPSTLSLTEQRARAAVRKLMEQEVEKQKQQETPNALGSVVAYLPTPTRPRRLTEVATEPCKTSIRSSPLSSARCSSRQPLSVRSSCGQPSSDSLSASGQPSSDSLS